MHRILDRYVLREIGPNFLLGLLVFSFVILLNEILRMASILITQGASFARVGGVLLNLLPSVFCLTVPIATLLGVLLALGRLSADSEIVALRASGISLYRLLVPILITATLTWVLSSYLIIWALPDSNQRSRQLLFQIMTDRAKTEVRPRVFYDTLFPNLMFLVLDIPTGADVWNHVLLADLSSPAAPRLTLAEKGRLLVDAEKRMVSFHLKRGETHQVSYDEPEKEYRIDRFGDFYLPLPADGFFPPEDLNVPRGARELHMDQLVQKYQETGEPVFKVEIYKKFAIPFACFVFGVLGLALGVHNQKGGRSWGFLVSIAVVIIYYVVIQLGEGVGKQGKLSPFLAMWSANLLLAAAGAVILARNAREGRLPTLQDLVYGVGRVLPAGLRTRRAWWRRVPTPPLGALKVPRIRLRFPGTLDRYVAREFCRNMLLILAALVAVYVLGILVEAIEEAFQHNVKGKVVLFYIGACLPQIFFHMLPLATLMATLVTFALLSKTSELTAIKASGISLYRAAIPVIALGAIVSTACFAIQEYVLPFSNRRAAELNDEIRKRPVETYNVLKRRWMLGHEQQIYHYGFFDPKQNTFSGLAIYRYRESPLSLSSRLYAQRAFWDPQDQKWVFEKGWTRNFDAAGGIVRFETTRDFAMEPPAYFVKEERQSDQMTFKELRAYISDLATSGFDVVRFEVALHSKISFPLAALVTALIALPFSFTPGKKGAIYGIGLAIAIGLVYYVTTRIFASMGETAMLPPFLAAWAPNILFSVGALYGLFTART